MRCLPRIPLKIFTRTNIFQQPESTAAREAMDNVLDRLCIDNPRGEVIFRRQLLSAYSLQEEEHQVIDVIASTLAEVGGILDPLLLVQMLEKALSLSLVNP
jgi:hypothetical protein